MPCPEPFPLTRTPRHSPTARRLPRRGPFDHSTAGAHVHSFTALYFTLALYGRTPTATQYPKCSLLNAIASVLPFLFSALVKSHPSPESPSPIARSMLSALSNS